MTPDELTHAVVNGVETALLRVLRDPEAQRVLAAIHLGAALLNIHAINEEGAPIPPESLAIEGAEYAQVMLDRLQAIRCAERQTKPDPPTEAVPAPEPEPKCPTCGTATVTHFDGDYGYGCSFDPRHPRVGGFASSAAALRAYKAAVEAGCAGQAKGD